MVEGWGQGGTSTERMAGEEEKRRDLVQLRREEVTGGEVLGMAERGGALPTVLVKLYYLTFGFSQGQ